MAENKETILENQEEETNDKKHFPVRLVILIVVLVLSLTAAILIGFYNYYLDFLKKQVIREITIESGSTFSVTDFFTPEAPNIKFITNVSGIDTNIPASYKLKVKTHKYYVETTEEVILNIVDTTPPTGTAIPQHIYWDEIPDVHDIVTDINDLAPVSVEYAQPMGEIMADGEQIVPVRLTDAYDNETIIDVPFTVINDSIPPIISGTKDLEVFIGDTIIYRNGVSIRDNYDPHPTLTIDTSEVNTLEEGVYPVVYTATDEHGNHTSVTVKLTVRQKPERYYDPDMLYDMAREVIVEENICDESMSELEITLRIFDWVSRNMWYISSSDRVDWTAGAYDGLTTFRGDCYNFMAVARAMLGAMGIDSITIDRYPEIPSPHFWNLVKVDGQWYHCDPCVFLNMTDITFYCCRIDSELTQGHSSYDVSTLPEGITVATESVQDRLDYANLTVRDVEE